MALTLSKLVSSFGRFAPTMSVLMLSQVISAGSLFLLPILGLGVSDLYSVGIQLGTGPYNGLVMGVVYLILIGRPSFKNWKWVNISVIAFTLSLGAYTLFSHPDVVRSTTAGIIFTLFCVGGIFLGFSGVRAVRHACLGNPTYLAGLTILPNLGMGAATGLTGIFLKSSLAGPFMPAIAWTLCAACTFWAMMRVRLPITSADASVLAVDDEVLSNKLIHVAGLGVGLVTSTFLPIGFISAASSIGSGASTLLFISSRVGSAIIGVVVNAVLMVNVNWKSSNGFSHVKPLMFIAASIFFAFGAIFLKFVFVKFEFYSYAAVACSWLLSAMSSPFLLRQVNAGRMGLTILVKSVLDAALSLAILLNYEKEPTLSGYFGALMMSQYLTCFICSVSLRIKSILFVSLIGGFSATILIIRGW